MCFLLGWRRSLLGYGRRRSFGRRGPAGNFFPGDDAHCFFDRDVHNAFFLINPANAVEFLHFCGVETLHNRLWIGLLPRRGIVWQWQFQIPVGDGAWKKQVDNKPEKNHRSSEDETASPD